MEITDQQIADEKLARDAKMELGISMLKKMAAQSSDKALAEISLRIVDILLKVVAERDKLSIQLLNMGRVTFDYVENPGDPEVMKRMMALCDEIAGT